MKLAPQPTATPWTPEEALDVARLHGRLNLIAVAADHDRLVATLIAYAGMHQRIRETLIVLDDEIGSATVTKNALRVLQIVRGVLDGPR